MSELIPVNIVIGDRTYRIKTRQSDEEVIRKTLKLINDKIVEFKTQFAGKDMQDYIAMVIIWYTTQNANNEGETFQTNEFSEAILKMEAMVDKAL